jgi:hypothetical protein
MIGYVIIGVIMVMVVLIIACAALLFGEEED